MTISIIYIEKHMLPDDEEQFRMRVEFIADSYSFGERAFALVDRNTGEIVGTYHVSAEALDYLDEVVTSDEWKDGVDEYSGGGYAIEGVASNIQYAYSIVTLGQDENVKEYCVVAIEKYNFFEDWTTEAALVYEPDY